MPNRLFVEELLSVGMVKAGDNPDSTVVIYKSFDKRQIPRDRRAALAREGKAIPRKNADGEIVDGSFPIETEADLRNAIQAFGRAAESERNMVKEHIVRRARALGATEILPESWNVSKLSPKAESLPNETGVGMDLSAIEDADLRKQIEDLLAAKDEEIAKLTEVEPDPVDDAPPEVQAIIKEQAAKLEDLEKALADERTARRIEDFTKKAEPLGVVLGKATEAGPILADIAERAPDSYEKLEPMLVAAAARLNEGGLFKEYGAGEGEAEADPIERRDAWVAKNRKDDETVVQARKRFWAAHPEEKEALRS